MKKLLSIVLAALLVCGCLPLIALADEAPIGRIQDRARAHVLMKLLNHPDTDRLIERFQEMAGEEWPARVMLEINPASLA